MEENCAHGTIHKQVIIAVDDQTEEKCFLFIFIRVKIITEKNSLAFLPWFGCAAGIFAFSAI